jgi:hypothetical protein
MPAGLPLGMLRRQGSWSASVAPGPVFLVPWRLEPLTSLPERAPPSVAPREVLHVPKAPLA